MLETPAVYLLVDVEPRLHAPGISVHLAPHTSLEKAKLEAETLVRDHHAARLRERTGSSAIAWEEYEPGNWSIVGLPGVFVKRVDADAETFQSIAALNQARTDDAGGGRRRGEGREAAALLSVGRPP